MGRYVRSHPARLCLWHLTKPLNGSCSLRPPLRSRADTASESREVSVFQDDLQDVGVSISSEEAKKLLFLAERKYNRYDVYAPGETFQQRLVDWLSNFESRDRNIAMAIVADLRFVSQQEA